MKRLQRAALLVSLAEKLKAQGSWCGETHIQKGIYVLQELLKVPLELDFCLYKHGPYSFDLSDELTSLRADGIFAHERQPYPYGPKLKLGEAADKLKELYPRTLRKYDSEISFVADNLGASDVKALERLATALYVTIKGDGSESVEDRAAQLHEIKSHVCMEDARQAVELLDRLQAQAKRLLAA